MTEDDEDEFDGKNSPDSQSKIDELQGLSEEELGRRARKAQLVDLLAKLELGILSHQEHAVLRNLLKDNGLNLMPWTPRSGNEDPRTTTPTEPAAEPAPLPSAETLQDPEYGL